MRPKMALSLAASLLLISGCVEQGKNSNNSNLQANINGNSINLEKYSERTQGSMAITVYKSPNSESQATIYRDTRPADFSENGLKKEIYKVVVNTDSFDMNNPPKTHQIDGHTAISTRLIQVTKENRLPTNNVPDLYVTIIGYPEKNMILSITSNGNDINWDTHDYLVSILKL